MLSVYKLKVFTTVAQAGSFSKAAEQLYLTQSAISQHVQGLEAHLGVQLFQRGRRGVQLTPSGEKLLEYAHQILSLIAAAENEITNVEQVAEGHLHLGATSSAAMYLLPSWIRTFRQRFPALKVSLHTGDAAQLIDDLLGEKLHLAFIEGDWEITPRINHLPLRDSELYVVVAPHHPWHDQESISITDLNRQLFIAYPPKSQARNWMDDLFAQYQVSPLIVAEFDEAEAIKRAVMQGMEAAILPRCVVREECQAGKIHLLAMQEQPLKRPIELLWNAGLPLNPTNRAFLETLTDQFPQLLELTQSPLP